MDARPSAERIAAALPASLSRGARGGLRRTDARRRAGEIVEVLTFLRDDPACQFKQLIDICGADWPEREQALRRGLSSAVAEARTAACASRSRPTRTTPVPSSSASFPAPTGTSAKPSTSTAFLRRPSGSAPHPHRLRLPGHPLRKDFPMTGYRRGALRRRAQARGLRAGASEQEFRNFDFLSPWEGASTLPGTRRRYQPRRRRERDPEAP